MPPHGRLSVLSTVRPDKPNGVLGSIVPRQGRGPDGQALSARQKRQTAVNGYCRGRSGQGDTAGSMFRGRTFGRRGQIMQRRSSLWGMAFVSALTLVALAGCNAQEQAAQEAAAPAD